MFENLIFEEDQCLEYMKNSQISVLFLRYMKKECINPNKQQVQNMNKNFTKVDIQRINKHMKDFQYHQPLHACMLSRFSLVQLCANPIAAAHQAPPWWEGFSLGFSRQEYWNELSISHQGVQIKTTPIRKAKIKMNDYSQCFYTHRLWKSWITLIHENNNLTVKIRL